TEPAAQILALSTSLVLNAACRRCCESTASPFHRCATHRHGGVDGVVVMAASLSVASPWHPTADLSGLPDSVGFLPRRIPIRLIAPSPAAISPVRRGFLLHSASRWIVSAARVLSY